MTRYSKELEHMMSHQLAHSFFNNVSTGLEVYDRDGYLVEINKVQLNLLGIRGKNKVLGISIYDNPLIPQRYKEQLMNGENLTFKTKYDPLKHADFFGATSPYLNSKYFAYKILFYRDDEGSVQYIIISISNETDFILSQKQLKEFELLYDNMANMSKIGIIKRNPYTMQGLVHKQWIANFGVTEKEQNDYNLLYQYVVKPETHFFQHFAERVKQSLAEDELEVEKEVELNIKGEKRWLKVFLRALYDPLEDGNKIIVGSSIDITEFVEVRERAIQSDKLKSLFLSNMSHEIRTPLNAIVGFSSLLVSSDEQEERQDYMKIIQENNDLLLKLISDILDLSKMEAGTLDISKKTFNLKELCYDIFRAMQMKISDSVEFLFDQEAPDILIYSDRMRLMQAITNLCTNSIKFTSKGFIRLEYVLEGDEVIISVSDSGIGMTSDQLKSVFDRFVKYNSFIQGTGLGLSITKQIIELLGGTVGVESEMGVGSRFWFKLPV